MIQLNRIIMIALMAVLCAEFTACDDKIPITDIFVENKSDEVIYATYIDIYGGRYEDIYLDRAMASALDEIIPGETCRVYVLGEAVPDIYFQKKYFASIFLQGDCRESNSGLLDAM